MIKNLSGRIQNVTGPKSAEDDAADGLTPLPTTLARNQSAYDARDAGYVHVERRPGIETRFPPFSNILNGESGPWATSCMDDEHTADHFAMG
jgi:hypothetical protein